jgi:putative spermidine/putrescine transport system ATP-binding protein
MKQSVPIQLENINFAYGDAPAVQNISLDIRPSELVVLVGPSGCGKSTLLKLVAGLIFPDTGQLRINGRETHNLPPEKRNIGWVPQSYALFEHLNVSQNVEFGLKTRRISRKDRQQRVQQMLDLCRIPELAQRSVADLSGGQRQRVAIARALAIQPDVLLLDEPLAALDPQLRLQLRTDLDILLRDAGITTLFVTHDQDEALALADRVAVLNAGQLVQFDTPETLWQHPTAGFVAEFIGNASVIRSQRLDADTIQILPGVTLPISGDHTPVIALRATDLTISSNGHGADLLVKSVEFTGDQYRITGYVGTHTLKLLTEHRVSPGEQVRVVLQPNRTPVIIEE